MYIDFDLYNDDEVINFYSEVIIMTMKFIAVDFRNHEHGDGTPLTSRYGNDTYINIICMYILT